MGDRRLSQQRAEPEPLPTLTISDQGPFIRAAGPIGSEWKEISSAIPRGSQPLFHVVSPLSRLAGFDLEDRRGQ